MATRTYNFITGIETSDAPSGTTPSATGDIMTKGYADTTYARRRDWGFTASDYTALKAIGTTGDDQRYDGQSRLVTGTDEIWRFDAGSSATEDGSTILQPTSGTGRWLLVSASGGGGGSSSGFESLTQKLELDYQTAFQTEALDNSVGRAFIGEDYWEGVSGSMLDNGASGATGITVVWNAKTVNPSSLNIDATTNWTVQNAGASLTATSTAGEFKVGTAALKFDKNNTATTATIRYDRGAQDFSLAAHWRMFFWVKLPSLTNLSNVIARVYADSTSNFATWNLSANYAGQALVADWNLMFVDLSTSPTSSGGTGWTKASSSRYIELGVTASSSAQTYTGIIFDSLYFSLGDVTALGNIGAEHTIFNTSTKQDIVLDAANVSGDGFLSLASTTPLTAAYNGGLTSSNGFIQRSVLKSYSNAKTATFDSNFSSGTVATSQSYRISAMLRESQSGNFTGFVDYWQPDIFKVISISGNNVSGLDFGNVSSNNLSGDSYDWFRPYFSRENVRYIYLGNKVINSNTTYDSSNAYIKLPLTDSTGVSGGDILSRRQITSSLSVVSQTANENMQSFTSAVSPNGIQLINEAITIPQKETLYGWWKLGGINTTQASKGIQGSVTTSLSTTGTLSVSNPLNYNEYYATNTDSASYYTLTTPTSIEGNTERAMFMFWLYLPSTTNARVVYGVGDSTFNNGHRVATETTAGTLTLYKSNGGATTSNITISNIPTNKWILVAGAAQTGVAGFFYVGGQYSTTGTGAIGSASSETLFMGGFNSQSIAGLRMSNLIIWRNPTTDLSYNQLLAMENNGNFRAFEFGGTLRNKYQLTGQSGQKLSMKVSASKNTTAVTGPFIKKFGVIKT